jgi:tight adherence protein C
MASGVILFFMDPGDSDLLRSASKKRVFSLPDRSRVNERLALAGRQGEYEGFRLKQVTYACWATILIFFLSLIATKLFMVAILLASSGGFLTFLFVDRRLTTEVGRNRREIEAEFASIIEMLTLALSAGESPLGAITRISRRSEGLFATQLVEVVASVRQGVPFHNALDEMGRKLESVPIRRFVDALITAMLRGAPLIEVLHRHAADARQSQRNIVMDRAGKAEISMMIPVVFLILPISVLFALWPSLTHLNLFAS